MTTLLVASLLLGAAVFKRALQLTRYLLIGVAAIVLCPLTAQTLEPWEVGSTPSERRGFERRIAELEARLPLSPEEITRELAILTGLTNELESRAIRYRDTDFGRATLANVAMIRAAIGSRRVVQATNSLLDTVQLEIEWQFSKDDERARIVYESADRKYQAGADRGDRVELERAIVILRDYLLPLRPREAQPFRWALVQVKLGYAYTRLGEMTGDAAQLQQGLFAFRLAQEEFPKESQPELWSATQGEIGTSLRIIGEHELDVDRLEQSVALFRELIAFHSGQKGSVDWAETQFAFANACSALGRATNNVQLLEEATRAYRNAFSVVTADADRSRWSIGQANLAVVLRDLGVLTGDRNYLKQSVESFRAATPSFSRGTPAWMHAYNGLGGSLRFLGQFGTGTRELDDAVSAYRLAIGDETSKARMPALWILVNANMSYAMGLSAFRKRDGAMLQRAMNLCEQARQLAVAIRYQRGVDAAEAYARNLAAFQSELPLEPRERGPK